MAHRSLHIGLNFVDPAGYDGWNGQLAACERDADDMLAIARAQGYETCQLKREKATSAAVLKELADAAATVKPGEHTLRIVVVGKHNKRSTGARVDIDAFVVSS